MTIRDKSSSSDSQSGDQVRAAAVPPPQPEICICAAVQFSDGRIVRGHRHDSCFRTAEGWTPKPEKAGLVQGFMTSRNRFVDREEGARLQDAAGIVSAFTGKPIVRTLFSEDLYFDSHEHARLQEPAPLDAVQYKRQMEAMSDAANRKYAETVEPGVLPAARPPQASRALWIVEQMRKGELATGAELDEVIAVLRAVVYERLSVKAKGKAI